MGGDSESTSGTTSESDRLPDEFHPDYQANLWIATLISYITPAGRGRRRRRVDASMGVPFIIHRDDKPRLHALLQALADPDIVTAEDRYAYETKVETFRLGFLMDSPEYTRLTEDGTAFVVTVADLTNLFQIVR